MYGGALGGFDPVVGDPGLFGRPHDLWVVRVEEHLPLCFEELVFVLDGRGLQDAVGVVQDETDVAQAADAGFRAHRG